MSLDASAAPPAATSPRNVRPGVTVTAVLLVAVNLRAAVTSVGPVLEEIQADLGLSAAGASALTALPLICFGLAALFAPTLSRRLGIERSLALVLAVTTLGLAVRVTASTGALFLGTLMAGAGIAVGNVLVPAVIKRDFPERGGQLMGLYVGTMACVAAVAAATTVPISTLTGWGWRGGLGFWTLPAIVALIPWLARARTGSAEPVSLEQPSGSLRRDALAWQVTLFLGWQSTGFYALVAWLPGIYRSHGFTAQHAGLLLSVLVIVSVPIAVVVPALAARARQQQGWAVGTTALIGVGLLGVLVAPTASPLLWTLLLGIGYGATFSLALTLVVLRARNAVDAARLSGMTQSIGYLLSSTGPFAFGLLHDITGGWNAPLIMLLAMLVPQMLCGLGAGRRAHVGGRA